MDTRKTNPVRRFALFIPLFLFIAALCALSQNSNAATEDGINLVHKGKLTVCTHLPYKPFEFSDNSGDVVGFDVDLANLLANDLGVKLDVVSIGWNMITSGAVFAADKCDIAMGGASITAKRKQSVQFSDPYFKASQALLVKKNSDISGLADMQGKRLGVQTATTGQVYAQKHADQYGYDMVVFGDLALLTTAVSSGKVDASMQDSAPLATYAKNIGDTKVVKRFDTGERYGFMAAKDNKNADKLIKRFNQDLAKARKDGTYAARYKHWFGLPPGHSETSGS
jgi:polar amino acid transport system substrate-binding protein